MLTERDIFLSSNPKSLLQPYSRNQLEVLFGPSNRSEDKDIYIDELIDIIYTKYTRIDLIKWDPISETAFFDYILQEIVSLEYLNENFNKYQPIALQHLLQQLDFSLERWIRTEALPFIILAEKIKERIEIILNAQFIYD